MSVRATARTRAKVRRILLQTLEWDDFFLQPLFFFAKIEKKNRLQITELQFFYDTNSISEIFMSCTFLPISSTAFPISVVKFRRDNSI